MNLQQAVDKIEMYENPVGPFHLTGDITVWILPESSNHTVITIAGETALEATVRNDEENCNKALLRSLKAA